MPTPASTNNQGLVGGSNTSESASKTIASPMQTSSQSLVQIAVHRIENAQDIERERRKLDPLFEYHYFDRNKALCIAYATQQGLAIGTCVNETKMYAAKLVLSGKHKHKDVQLIEQTMDNGHGRQIYHVAILVKTPTGVRYVTHSNGFHYDNSWDVKCQLQCPVTLNPYNINAVSVNGKLIRWRKKDWRAVKNKWKCTRAKNTSRK
jgi:hypothetical protein